MGSLQSWRKAYGALKDSTTVNLAKINSDYKDLDIAIVKATNHVESPPKERHIQKILVAISAARPREDVVYCVQAFSRRLHKTHNWAVALKTLMVIHRILKEGEPIFREELLRFSQRGQMLNISNFKDDSSPLAWDCSAWVRTFGVFLEERLECFKILKYDIVAKSLSKSPQRSDKEVLKKRFSGHAQLLEHLPALQLLLFRFLGCKPEGAAAFSYLIQFALILVLKESFKIYRAINDGIVDLVDLFFEMPRHDAIRALDIYKKSIKQAEELSGFYEHCKGLELAKSFQFPTLKQPPSSFLSTMEEHIKEAPSIGSVPDQRVECTKESSFLSDQEKDLPIETSKISADTEEEKQEKQTTDHVEQDEPQGSVPSVPQASASGDLLSMDDTGTSVAEVGKDNGSSSPICQPGDNPDPFILDKSLAVGGSGWELALVSAPSSNDSHVTESKLAGGFDKFLLESLYDSADTSNQQNVEAHNGGVDPNPYGFQDPFAASNALPAAPNVQMATMAQQQIYIEQQQQSTSTIPFSPSQFPQPPVETGTANPFGDLPAYAPQNTPPQSSINLL